MRKNKAGRPPKIEEVQMFVAVLREQQSLSYTEIAEKLELGSRQLARYHYQQWLKKKAGDNSS